MLNTRKTRLMTKLAIYEKRAGKEDIKLSKYYKTDYVRYNMLKSVVAVTFGYFIILAMIVLYQSEYLIREAVNLNYYEIVKFTIGIYILILTVYIAASLLGYSLYYSISRKRLAKYFRMLRRLRTIYREEDGEIEREEQEEC